MKRGWRGDGEGAAQRQPGWAVSARSVAAPSLLGFQALSVWGESSTGPEMGMAKPTHSPLAVFQADCGSPVWSARGSSFDAVYCSDVAHGKPDPPAARGQGVEAGSERGALLSWAPGG